MSVAGRQSSVPVKGSYIRSSFSRKLCCGVVNRYLIHSHEHAVFKDEMYDGLLMCADKRTPASRVLLMYANKDLIARGQRDSFEDGIVMVHRKEKRIVHLT